MTTPFIKHALKGKEKTIGILGLMVLIFIVTSVIAPSYLDEPNLKNMGRYVGLYGIIAVGVSFVIITGGIDLSIGSLIGLMATLFPMLVREGSLLFPSPVSPLTATLIVLAGSALVGLIHGLLITRLRLQPFIVTLCGLLIYRGLARSLASDQSKGFGNDFDPLRQALAKGEFLGIVPMPLVILLLIGVVAAILLNKTVFGRHLLALGRNENAARFSGIHCDRMKISAYVVCSTISGFCAILFSLDTNGVTPSQFGNFYELWAIAGAVLGGVSLRGGEGTISGVICGAALVQVTMTAAFFLGVPDSWKYAVIGIFILVGVIIDELLKRFAARRRAREGAGA